MRLQRWLFGLKNSTTPEVEPQKVAKSPSSPKSQSEEILAYLRSGRAITPLEALERFGCFRLGGRIYDLKKQGHSIKTTMVERNGKRYAEYLLEKPIIECENCELKGKSSEAVVLADGLRLCVKCREELRYD